MMLAEKAAEELINLYGAQTSTPSSSEIADTTTISRDEETTTEQNGSESTVSSTVTLTLVSGVVLSAFYF